MLNPTLVDVDQYYIQLKITESQLIIQIIRIHSQTDITAKHSRSKVNKVKYD
jgi:hypothetical protein